MSSVEVKALAMRENTNSCFLKVISLSLQSMGGMLIICCVEKTLPCKRKLRKEKNEGCGIGCMEAYEGKKTGAVNIWLKEGGREGGVGWRAKAGRLWSLLPHQRERVCVCPVCKRGLPFEGGLYVVRLTSITSGWVVMYSHRCKPESRPVAHRHI